MKFRNASRFYSTMFPFNGREVQKIAVTGFSAPRDPSVMDFGFGIQVRLVPDFVQEIAQHVCVLDPWRMSINESSYPLLRAVQFGTFYLKRLEKQRSRVHK